jgi:hypothetical protein
MVLLTPVGELMIRILRWCRLGSGDAIAGRGVSGSGGLGGMGNKVFCHLDLPVLTYIVPYKEQYHLTSVLHIRNIYSVMSL